MKHLSTLLAASLLASATVLVLPALAVAPSTPIASGPVASATEPIPAWSHHTVNIIGASPSGESNVVGFAVGDDLTYGIHFSGDPGLIDPRASPRVTTTDGKPGSVLVRVPGPVHRVFDPFFPEVKDVVEMYRWRGARAGTASIDFVDDHGLVVGHIDATVSPSGAGVNLGP